MAPNQGQVITTAWETLHGDGPTDNIFNSHALLSLLRDGGYTEYADGGRLFEYAVEYATNPNFKSYSEMEILDTVRTDVFDVARFEQRIHAGTVVFSDLEKLRNAPANRKMDIEKKKIKNGTNSALESLNAMLFGDGTGNGGKDFDGLSKIIPDDPTTGTVGGINAGTWSFWRSRAQSGAKTTSAYDNFKTAHETTYNLCTLGGAAKKPTGIVSSRQMLEVYNTFLIAIENLVKDGNGESEADLSWPTDAIAFKGIPWVYDEQITLTDNTYFINKNFLQLTTLKGAWLKMKDPVEPGNQLTSIHRVMTVGNLCASARRHLGVCYDIT